MASEKRLKVEDGVQSIYRPVLNVPNPAMNNLLLNWVDIDTYTAPQPLRANPKQGANVPGSTIGPVPVIRFFGVTNEGCSVAVHVHGFTPYFYCDPPSVDFNESKLGEFKSSLELRVVQDKRGFENQRLRVHVLGVELCSRQSVFGYGAILQPNMLKIYIASPSLIGTARGILERGFRFSSCGGPERAFQTYESNVPFVLRYMVDQHIQGCSWLELPARTYRVRGDPQKETRCQLEVDVVYDSVVAHDVNQSEQFARIGRFRVLSFDIECMGRKGHFPDPKHDPVIQIANVVSYTGEDSSLAHRVVLVLGGCSPIVHAEVRSFLTEQELLLAWADLVRCSDCDVLTGYNVQNFDMPYLLNRAKELKIDARFEHLGRVLGNRARMKNATFSSSAFGTRESVETQIDGRVMVDMIQYMWRNHKLSSYSLNAVSAEFLGMQKEDVHHSIISVLQRGSDEDRHRLAVYCLKDALLPLNLMNKLLVLVNYVEMARVTGVPLPFLLSRGQQIKVLSMMYRKAREHDMVIPVFAKQQQEDGKGGGGEGTGYEGATVLEPKCAFYQTPIATLDFASLYPSIMRARNLCYTTLLNPEETSRVPESERELSPTGHWFVKSSTRKGLLPIILEELLTARSQAKKAMKNAKDPFMRDVMNGRQLALKVSANSVYGFTGATVGALPCIPISSSVTAYGRDMIKQTKYEVERVYTVEQGYPGNAECIYGDTDSVFVKFGVDSVEQAIQLGTDAAARITKIFPPPVALEFEKVYFPYLLMAKKRYAGLYWTRPDKYDKLDCKGIETVRRDNCQLVRRVIDTCLRKILIEQRVQDAVKYAQNQISLLLHNQIDISLLIVSKSLSGDASSYKNKQPHVELAEKMRKRDPGSAPSVGDRVPYVIVQAAKNTPVYQKSEDPLYVLENSIPIDTRYYLEQQLSKPLLRLFESILPNPSVLLTGDHTRSVLKVTPSAKTGLMRFAVKVHKCLGCKVPIPVGNDKGMCDHCQPKRTELYLKHLQVYSTHEARFSELWTQCQRCQGSLHQEVLCTSRDCPIFYMRKKVQKDLHDTQTLMERFDF